MYININTKKEIWQGDYLVFLKKSNVKPSAYNVPNHRVLARITVPGIIPPVEQDSNPIRQEFLTQITNTFVPVFPNFPGKSMLQYVGFIIG